MKPWVKYALGYVPPLAILSFLLLTNLFTRARFFRDYLLPEHTITISAEFAEESSDEMVVLTDTAAESGSDTIGCGEPLYLSAREAFDSRDYQSARSLWLALLDSTSCNRGDLRNSIGVTYLRDGRIKEAQLAFEAAIGEDSANARAWYNLGVCQSRRNHRVEASASYRKAIRLMPGMNKAHFNLGVLAMRQKHYEEARRYFQRALDWGMGKPVCLYNIALTYQREDQLDKALKDYRESIRFDPSQTAARLRMVEIFLTRGAVDSATATAQNAARIDPGNAEVGLRLARIAIDQNDFDRAMLYLNDVDKKHPDLFEVDYQRARIYGLRGEDKRALRMYRQIMARDPGNPRVYYNIGVNLMDLGMQQEAVDAYNQALKSDPSYWKAAYNLGVHYLRQDEPTQAAAFFRQVVHVTPDRPQAHYNLGLAALKAGKLGEARHAFELAVQLDTSYVEGRYNLGLTLMRDGVNDSAITLFESVLNLDRCHSKSLYNLGLLYRRQNDDLRANRYFANAIRCRKGEYSNAWYMRALCQRSLGLMDSALISVHFATAQADSDNVPAKALLLSAELFDTLGMKDSAMAVVRRADSLCGNDIEALENLAQAYARHGSLQKQREVYHRILQAAPNGDIDILLALARVEEQLGSPDSAQQAYAQALEMDKENVEIVKSYAAFLQRTDKAEQALPLLEQAVILDPSAIDTRIEIAMIQANAGHEKALGQTLEKLQRLDIHGTHALTLGRLLYKTGRYSDARSILQATLNDSSVACDAQYLSLLCSQKLATTEFDAQQEWQHYCDTFPHDYRGYYMLARVHMAQQAWPVARKLLNHALELSDDEQVRSALEEVCGKLGQRSCI